MTPEEKIWIILKNIDNALEITPNNNLICVDTREVENILTRQDHEQIFEKLIQDYKIIEIDSKPDYQKNFYYKFTIINNENFRKFINIAHRKHYGSLEMLDGDNFLAVTDVSMDIMNGLQMTEIDEVTIPLWQSLVKFSSLMPRDGVNWRDRYCDLRWKALSYLKNNENIKDFILNDDDTFHRWETTITVSVEKIRFTSFYEKLVGIYEKRVRVSSEEKVKTNNNASVTSPLLTNTGKNPYQILIDIIDVLLRKIEIAPKNQSVDNKIKIHVSETPLPQNISGIEELAQTLNRLKESGALKHVQQSDKVWSSQIGKSDQNLEGRGAKFTITEPDKELLSKAREKLIMAGDDREQSPIPIYIVDGQIRGEMKIDGLQDGLKTIAQSKKETDKPKFPYKLPAGTTWENISIKFLDDENVFIKVRQFEHTTSYKEMGFIGKGNNPNPSEAWIFLKVLAQVSGELTLKDLEARDKYKKQKELLAKSLQEYFSLDYDPFYPYRSSSEKKGNSYKIKITLIPLTDDNKKTAVDEEEDDLGVKEYLKEHAPQINEE